jgi:predicted nicotinamide N-methyase
MAAGGAGVAMPAGVPPQAVEIAFGALRLQLWRAADLAGHVDVEAQLRDERPPEPPYWMHLWPGAVALARRVAEAPEIGPGVRVLELGCGLALPALTAARRGARVVASDWLREPLQFARRSAADNGCALGLVQSRWGELGLRGGFDLCLGADVGYDRGAEAGLIATLARLTGAGGAVWLADSVNTARATLAAGLAAAGFAVEVRQVQEREEGRPVWVRMITARRR